MDEIELLHKNGTRRGFPWGLFILLVWLAGNISLHMAGYLDLALALDFVWVYMALGGIVHFFTHKPIARIHIKKNFISLYAPGKTQPFYSNSLSAITYAANYNSLKIKDAKHYFHINNSAFKDLKRLIAFMENTGAKKIEYKLLKRPIDFLDFLEDIIGAPYGWVVRLFRAN